MGKKAYATLKRISIETKAKGRSLCIALSECRYISNIIQPETCFKGYSEALLVNPTAAARLRT
jgi:hypothetical protein